MKDWLFTLKSADLTYRLMVEEMQTGAVTLSSNGDVLYCNPYLAALLDLPVGTVVLGAPLSSHLDEPTTASLRRLLQAAENGVARGEILVPEGVGSVPTSVALPGCPSKARLFSAWSSRT